MHDDMPTISRISNKQSLILGGDYKTNFLRLHKAPYVDIFVDTNTGLSTMKNALLFIKAQRCRIFFFIHVSPKIPVSSVPCPARSIVNLAPGWPSIHSLP